LNLPEMNVQNIAKYWHICLGYPLSRSCDLTGIMHILKSILYYMFLQSFSKFDNGLSEITPLSLQNSRFWQIWTMLP